MTNTLKRHKILIVEDDPDLGPLFAEILDDIGYSTNLIADGALAFEGIVNNAPDLVILDMHLPHVSGIEILRQVRADERVQKTLVMVASANASLIATAKELADATLLKPIGYEILISTIERLMPIA